MVLNGKGLSYGRVRGVRAIYTSVYNAGKYAEKLKSSKGRKHGKSEKYMALTITTGTCAA